MKSSKAQLDKRGLLNDADYLAYCIDFKTIDSLISSQNAQDRTAAFRFLKYNKSSTYLPKLCEVLINEKCLYTKIELCETISVFELEALPYLDKLIGMIGKNQHNKIGLYDIGKKGFPLPRDIVSRIIVNMKEDALSWFKERIRKYDIKKLREVVDIIGHLTFYSHNKCLEDELIDIYNTTKDDIVKWKIVKAFQAFESDEIIRILSKLLNSDNEIMKIEAKRSIERIKTKSA